MRRNDDLEATIVAKFSVMAPVLDERARRLWAAAESVAIGSGGDALVSAATGLARETIRNGRRELAQGVEPSARIRRVGAGRPALDETQPGLTAALEALVEPVTRGDPMSPLRWTCKSRAKLTAALTTQGWQVSSTTVGRLLNALGLPAAIGTQESRRHVASRSECAVRAHQHDRGRLSAARVTRDLGRYQEEGIGRGF